MDIKSKICHICTWKKHLFLNISSNTNTLVPSLYQCVETCSIEVFPLLSQPLPHLHFNLFVTGERFDAKEAFRGTNKWKSLGAKAGL
jgi:hypothetical protein